MCTPIKKPAVLAAPPGFKLFANMRKAQGRKIIYLFMSIKNSTPTKIMILYHKRAAFFPKENSPALKTSRFSPGKQLLNEKYRTIVLGMKLVGFFMLIACLHAG